MNLKRVLGISLIIASIFISIFDLTLTGAVIGVSQKNLSIFSIFVFLAGFILLLIAETSERRTRARFDLTVEVGGLAYDPHALEKMSERHVYPSIVSDAIKNGEHYPLSHVIDSDETRGATDAFISRNCADILSSGPVGGRVIGIDPNRKRDFKNLIVLTDKKGVVKTVYLKEDLRLHSFLDRYVRKKVAAA
jgi:hypothetical protein